MKIQKALLDIKPNQRLEFLLKQRPALTRVAPSPTGFFHVGTARCALHNFLAAKASGGHFMLRLDDTDAARNDDAHAALIDSSLAALHLKPDRFAKQSDRALVHQSAGAAMLASGMVWRDTNGSLRLSDQAVDGLPSSFFDLCAGEVALSSTAKDQCRGLTVLRPDGTATYPLASVVDDIDFNINLILRGADHLSNTPKQLAIGLALAKSGWLKADDWVNHCIFAHVGLITKEGKKVSKRDGGSNLVDAFAIASPDAVAHWALRLGWSHPDANFDKDWETMTQNDMITLFPEGRLKGGNIDINLSKLTSLGKKYVHNSSKITSHVMGH